MSLLMLSDKTLKRQNSGTTVEGSIARHTVQDDDQAGETTYYSLDFYHRNIFKK